MNGYLKDGVTSYASMNGNGIKMGGSDATPHTLRHNMIVKNCLTFLNKAKGFDQNNNVGSMTLFNCTAYNNGIGTPNGALNFSTPLALASGKVLTVENCISAAPTKSPGYNFGNQVSPVFATNSWSSPFTGATAADFVSVDTTGVRGPRKADGSLPDINFMHLAAGSQFINSGTNVGLPFSGNLPDLGCFETSTPADVKIENSTIVHGFQLEQNYPNPFNPSTSMRFSVEKRGFTRLQVVNILGQHIQTLFAGQADPQNRYDAEFQASTLPSGIYFSILESGSERLVRKMMLIK
jgi:hypothetical protein